MKEIKFRAWTGTEICNVANIMFDEKSRMISKIDLYQNNNEEYLMCFCDENYFGYSPDEPKEKRVMFGNTFKKIVLMQYTGYKDKNNKMIFEGDIVRFKISKVMRNELNNYMENSLGIGKIRFGVGMFFIDHNLVPHIPLFFTSEPVSKTFDDAIDFYEENNLEYLKVIGNVHENPELLKKDQEEKIEA